MELVLGVMFDKYVSVVEILGA